MTLQHASSVGTIAHGPGDTMGFFECAYEPERHTVELRYAFREDLRAWIPEVPVPLRGLRERREPRCIGWPITMGERYG